MIAYTDLTIPVIRNSNFFIFNERTDSYYFYRNKHPKSLLVLKRDIQRLCTTCYISDLAVSQSNGMLETVGLRLMMIEEEKNGFSIYLSNPA